MYDDCRYDPDEEPAMHRYIVAFESIEILFYFTSHINKIRLYPKDQEDNC